jgi:hypothetical protein
MATPTFSKLNGQIKTAWRWYDEFHKLAEFQQGCEQGTNECPAPCILSAQDHLPPFQFVRPTSVAVITSWKLYDNDGNEVVNLAADIANFSIERFATWDIVIYGGAVLAVPLDPGLYYSRITTDGNIYYSEPVRVVCVNPVEDCYRRLSWYNCGNVGNTFFEEGFADEFWLDTQANPILPTPANRTESEEQADGTLLETFRRKEVRYTIRLGLVPWPAADALTDIPLMDTVQLHHTLGDGYDTLADVKVECVYDESVSECLPEVEIRFRIDNTAVACCDDFTRPCLVPCIDAEGFVSDVGPSSDGFWLDDAVSRYIEFIDGTQGDRIGCDSGSANIKLDAVEAIDRDNNVQTYFYDPALEVWIAIGVIYDVAYTAVPCELVIKATLLPGYSGQLQFWDGFTWTNADFDVLTADEWLVNSAAYIKEAGANYIRLRVLAGTCETGFTEAWPALVTC